MIIFISILAALYVSLGIWGYNETIVPTKRWQASGPIYKLAGLVYCVVFGGILIIIGFTEGLIDEVFRR